MNPNDLTSHPALLAVISAVVLHAQCIAAHLGVIRVIAFSKTNKPMRGAQRRQNLSRRLIGRGRLAGCKAAERSGAALQTCRRDESSTPDQAAGHVSPL